MRISIVYNNVVSNERPTPDLKPRWGFAAFIEYTGGNLLFDTGQDASLLLANLAAMGIEVFSIEIRSQLCESAAQTLVDLGYENAHVRCGDGYGGWPEEEPFDGIVVTAAPERIPEPLLEQLKEGAHMVIPVGAFYQELKVITRTADGFSERSVIPVRFVPMTGEIEWVD